MKTPTLQIPPGWRRVRVGEKRQNGRVCLLWIGNYLTTIAPKKRNKK